MTGNRDSGKCDHIAWYNPDLDDETWADFPDPCAMRSLPMGIPRMPGFLRPIRIEARAPGADHHVVARGEELRLYLVRMVAEDPGMVRTMIRGEGHIRNSAMARILNLYDGSTLALEELIARILLRSRETGQASLMGLIEELVYLLVMKNDPDIFARIAGGGYDSSRAIKALLGPLTDGALRGVSSGRHCRRAVAASCEEMARGLFPAPSARRMRSLALVDEILYRTGTVCVDFVPAKDETLFHRSCVAGDCSEGLDCQVTHSRSCFYKIIIDGAWAGYVTLLHVEDDGEGRAMLIDVFNMRLDPRLDHPALFEGFVDGLASRIEPEGFGYILVSCEREHISNSYCIGDAVWDRYCRWGRGVHGFKLNPFEESFQTAREKTFMAVRDFSLHGQLLLFEHAGSVDPWLPRSGN